MGCLGIWDGSQGRLPGGGACRQSREPPFKRYANSSAGEHFPGPAVAFTRFSKVKGHLLKVSLSHPSTHLHTVGLLNPSREGPIAQVALEDRQSPLAKATSVHKP